VKPGPEPISRRTAAIASRLRGATVARTVCPYCAVGCSQLAFTKNGVLIDVEGDPASPINEARQCPKGANTFELAANPHRVTKVRYRAPHSRVWEERTLDWAMDRIADLLLASRARGFVERNEAGIPVNHVRNVAFLGGSANDNEECYLFRKLLTGGLGIVPVENTARYCHSTTVAALAPTFGFGACTNPTRDLINSDCVLIMGSNMAEGHPVAFHWPVQAQKQGAVLIHVDPRFTRTSAVADAHVAIRPGSDVAFLGGLLHYILEGRRWFDEYVRHFTNAATLVSPEFAFDAEAGVFAGFDPATGAYDRSPGAWDYQYAVNADGTRGEPLTDPTMTDPQCVLQILRRQYAAYTPDKVATICGCRPEDVLKVAELLCRNSGRERTSAICYSMGWTQHASGAQMIRAAAIIQLLLGNVGRPGGGVIALRGHANVQGATDIPTLFSALPNYLPMPHGVAEHATLAGYLEHGHGFGGRRAGASDGMWRLETSRGSWASLPAYFVSLLKAWYGASARPDNEFGYAWLPKLAGNDSITEFFERMRHGGIEGLIVVAQNPAVSNANTRLARHALRELQWLVVRDIFETETAAVWYADPDGPPPEAVATEVFLLPAATALEKDGSVTNTERVVQWHERALDPPGDCRSDAWFIYELGKRLRARIARERLQRDAGLLALTWDYEPRDMGVSALATSPVAGEPDLERVLQEINGYSVADGSQLGGGAELRDDGTTASGSRLYCGVYPAADRNLARRFDGSCVGSIANDWRWAWPGDSRILYNRCSADAQGRPWSERKKLVWWDEARACWTGLDVPQFNRTKPPGYVPPPGARGDAALAGDAPFLAHTDGRGWLFVPYGMNDGPLPVHYEPVESPRRNALFTQQHTPGAIVINDPDNPMAAPCDPHYPLVLTTYRLVEHFGAGATTRHDSWLVELQPAVFAEISPELAAAHDVEPGGWIVIETPRAAVEVRVLVTPRLRALPVQGAPAPTVGLVWHSGYEGEVVGAVINDLSPAVLAPEGFIAASKGFVCRIHAGRLANGRRPKPLPIAMPREFDQAVPDTPWSAQPEGRA
jgi:formate dehydrogenase major subunit